MADERLLLQLLTQNPMADPWADGGAVLDAFEELTPEWAPRVWGHEDPPKQRYQRNDLPSVWWGGDLTDLFSWKGRGKGKPEVMVRLGELPGAPHSDLYLDAKADSVDPARAVALLCRLVERFGADYGYIHVATPADKTDSHPDSVSISPIQGPYMNAYSLMLRTGLPNVWWANIFGPPVVEVLGADRIATAPAEAVTELAGGAWLLQLTASPLDAVNDPDRFAAARSAVKAHLGFDAFWDPSVGKAGTYRAARLPVPRHPRPPLGPDGVYGRPVVYGPAGFTQRPDVRSVWEPFATEKNPGVWRLEGLGSEAVVTLVGMLPSENRTIQANAIPTLDRFADLARRHDGLTFSGTLAGPDAGTEGLTIDTLWVPGDVADTDIDAIAADADDDEQVAGGRALWWD